MSSREYHKELSRTISNNTSCGLDNQELALEEFEGLIYILSNESHIFAGFNFFYYFRYRKLHISLHLNNTIGC